MSATEACDMDQCIDESTLFDLYKLYLQQEECKSNVTHDNIYNNDFAQQQLAFYDEFVSYTISDIIEGEIYVTSDDCTSKIKIEFGQLYLTPPATLDSINASDCPLLPSQCVLQGLTYSADMDCAIVTSLYEIDSETMEEIMISTIDREVSIGKIPAMVGSVICTLKTCDIDSQFEESELDKLDKLQGTGGYFIINGQEKGLIDNGFGKELHILKEMFEAIWDIQIKTTQKKLLHKLNKMKKKAMHMSADDFDLRFVFDDDKLIKSWEDKIVANSNNISHHDVLYKCVSYNSHAHGTDNVNDNDNDKRDELTNVLISAEEEQLSETNINYLELDAYMTSLDDESLNKLTTAQLMQRLRAHDLPYNGLKHELIERWKNYKKTCS